MDPADADKIRQALFTQGACVGQHEKVVQEVMDVLRNLSSNVAQIGGHMDQLSTHLTSLTAPAPASAPAPPLPAPSVSHPTQPREPFIPMPARYSGVLGCKGFFSVVLGKS